VERDVHVKAPDPGVADAVTATDHANYDRYDLAIVATVVSTDAVRSTLRLLPRLSHAWRFCAEGAAARLA
jgi:hypothetical protein